MNLQDLRPSITELNFTDALALITALRMSRRQSKQPAKRAAKMENSALNILGKQISSMDPARVRAILSQLEEKIK
jgi:hypothetical protein